MEKFLNRRRFVKLSAASLMSLWVSGCGLSNDEDSSTAKGKQNSMDSKSPEQSSVSGGNKMKIVVINSSPHSDSQSTSKYLAKRFVEGAQSKGHEIFIFDADKEDTHPCKGCDQCGMNGACIFKDAIETKLMPKMLEADLLVLVTPLYYYGMSAQLKTVIDRFYSRTTKLNGKKSAIIATAYNSADWTMEALLAHYQTLVRYMNWNDVGQVWAIGCGSRSLVERSDFGEQAYKIGVNL